MMMASKQLVEPLTSTKPVPVSMQTPLSDTPGSDEVAFLPAVGANLRRLRT